MPTRKTLKFARMVRGFMDPVGRQYKRRIKQSLKKHSEAIAEISVGLLTPSRKTQRVWKSCGCAGDHGYWVEKIEPDDEMVIQVSELILPDMKKLDTGFFMEIGEAVSVALEQMTDIDSFFSIEDPIVAETLEGRGLDLAKSVSRSMKPELRKAMAEAMDAGEGLPGVRNAIRDRVRNLPEWKVDRLARTEANDAINAATDASFQNVEYIPKKEWVTIVDDRTSDVCLGLAGKIVGVKQDFPGGYKHPPAHPNCRSTVAPVFDPDAPDYDEDVRSQVDDEMKARQE